MKAVGRIRFVGIALVLGLGVWWAIASVSSGATKETYPQSEFIATVDWVKEHKNDENVTIIDVREKEYFDDRLVPGAVHLPWGEFRTNNAVLNLAGLFVGIEAAQQILGNYGVARTDTVVLYDSAERDGGATASYFFWVLDLLGHENKKILEGGIDAWIAANEEIASKPAQLESLLYQAPVEEIDKRKLAQGNFIYFRLGDPHYYILDVRSKEEYLGEKPNVALDGTVLKLGHIPSAVNIDYRLNWQNQEKKMLKPYSQLQQLYRGLDTTKPVVVYCHSGRRSSFSYFVLRVMGFKDVIVYDRSWNEWGNPDFFFPVETKENRLASPVVPDATGESAVTQSKNTAQPDEAGKLEPPKDGYVSCGG